MKLNRNIVKLSTKVHSKNDDGFVKGDMPTLFEMVWDITCDLWAFTGGNNAEQRLQRDVVNIIRPESTGREKDALDVKMLKKLKK